jgi:hypothetical protein
MRPEAPDRQIESSLDVEIIIFNPRLVEGTVDEASLLGIISLTIRNEVISFLFLCLETYMGATKDP